MIRVALFNWKNESFGVDLATVPVKSARDYCCNPEGILGLEGIQHISQELLEGRMSGWVQGYRWYRQAVSARESIHAPAIAVSSGLAPQNLPPG